MALTNNFNYLQPTGFKLVIDRTNYPNLEFFIQDFTHAGVIMNTADLQYKKIAAIPFIGDKLTYNEMLANIILDEDMKSYREMHSWMRRVLDQDMTTPVDRFKAKIEQPPATSDITLSILSSSNNPVVRIVYRDCIPVALTDIQFQATSGGESFLTFGASFRFTYFDILHKTATGAMVDSDSFSVTGKLTS
jgi:hypothetical protein|tara:strand:- start:473 stop:1045 length:573 start_codon:yes stop_codon:yes gene_type:complete